MHDLKITNDTPAVLISIKDQRLLCVQHAQVQHQFEVSTARRGAGQEQGSLQTPLGVHQVRAKIGGNAPLGAVFVGRRPTGEVWSRQLHQQFPGRDWILSRILWLSGSEQGYNRLGDVDTMRRFIYIHGTPDTEPMGQAHSHGCIRMRNEEVIELFNWVSPGTPVVISALAQSELLELHEVSARRSPRQAAPVERQR